MWICENTPSGILFFYVGLGILRVVRVEYSECVEAVGEGRGVVAGIFLTAMGDVRRRKGLTARVVMNIFTDRAYELRESVCFPNFTESLGGKGKGPSQLPLVWKKGAGLGKGVMII